MFNFIKKMVSINHIKTESENMKAYKYSAGEAKFSYNINLDSKAELKTAMEIAQKWMSEMQRDLENMEKLGKY